MKKIIFMAIAIMALTACKNRENKEDFLDNKEVETEIVDSEAEEVMILAPVDIVEAAEPNESAEE